VRNFFSHREVGPARVNPVTPRGQAKALNGPLVFARFIVQEKPTVISPVGEGLPEVPGMAGYTCF